MEWTKETLGNTCILCTSKPQSKRIIKFYKSFGCDDSGANKIIEGINPIKGRFIGATKLGNLLVGSRQYDDETLIKLPTIPRKRNTNKPL